MYLEKSSSRKPAIAYLTVIAIMSLGFIALTDRFFYKFLEGINSPLTIVADLRFTSLLILTVVFLLIRKTYSPNLQPKIEGRRATIRLAAIWLVMTGYFVLVQKVWVPTLKDWIDVVAFMITGLIGEEILFRGILFDLSSNVFGDKKLLKLSVPVLLTSALFGLQHLAYHHFELNPASITQVLYTAAMGIVFARIRESTGSLWLVIGFHMLNNCFTLIRNFG